MITENSPDYDSRPKVLVVSEPHPLSISVVESLISNFCYVKIITASPGSWKGYFQDSSCADSVQLISIEKLENEQADYLLVINDLLDIPVPYVTSTLEKYSGRLRKLFVLLPYSIESPTDKESFLSLDKAVKENNKSIKRIYVGDIFGRGITSLQKSLVARTVTNALSKNYIEIPDTDLEIYPLSADDVAKEVLRLLFSFGPVEGAVALLSKPKPYSQLVNYLLAEFPEKKFAKKPVSIIRSSEDVKNRTYLNTNLLKAIVDAATWVNKRPMVLDKEFVLPKVSLLPPAAISQTNQSTAFTKIRQILKHKKISQKVRQDDSIKVSAHKTQVTKAFLDIKKSSATKLVKILVSLVVVGFILPFLTMLVGVTFLVSGSFAIESCNFYEGERFFKVAGVVLDIDNAEFGFLAKPPVIGKAFWRSLYLTTALKRASSAGVILCDAGIKLQDLAHKVLGSESYDINGLSQDLSLDFDSLYKDSGFLFAELNADPSLEAKLIKSHININNLEGFREKLLSAGKIAKSLPVALGKAKPQTYLILFQNNMELRPTGGFIGSFALVTFDGGRLTNINVSDVYSADGQLKGHVEPPAPIKNYLGEAGWMLRDSNWDPDFAVSAERAEWFLDKEIDKSVDGVIACDLEFIKAILNVTGPVKLHDFNETITADNLYEKTQYEVEADFFPGSIKKASFLTSLARELISVVSDVKPESYTGLARETVKSLLAKDLQLYFHYQPLQEAIAALNFDGAVSLPSCGVNCYSDMVGVIEANLGVNKANYFVQRSAYFSVNLTGSRLERSLNITYANSANPALGESGKYKVYVRVLLPSDSEINSVEVSTQEERMENPYNIEDVHGRREVGTFLTVEPDSSKSVIFSWKSAVNLDFSKNGNYLLYVRKQAGVVNEPLFVKIRPFPVNAQAESLFTLTNDGSYVYNTNLDKDIFGSVNW